MRSLEGTPSTRPPRLAVAHRKFVATPTRARYWSAIEMYRVFGSLPPRSVWLCSCGLKR
jgi:hypothetical protein